MTHGDGSVCDAFEAIVGKDIRRGIRCDDAEAAYPLELETGPAAPLGAILWLIRCDGAMVKLWPRVLRDRWGGEEHAT